MMQRFRNAAADGLIGIVVVLVLLWLLRGVLGMVVWGARLIVVVVLIAVAFRVASKIRG